ncbi:MAG: hypothetical protein KAW47_03155, partial [Thermoplasmatales archaeon]|nr:hypothetical protein [Thermoplasmatales archaeon]
MVLDGQRERIDPILSVIAKRLSKVNPDTLTWIALSFAFFAGILFYFSSPEQELSNYYLFFAAFFVFMNG